MVLPLPGFLPASVTPKWVHSLAAGDRTSPCKQKKGDAEAGNFAQSAHPGPHCGQRPPPAVAGPDSIASCRPTMLLPKTSRQPRRPSLEPENTTPERHCQTGPTLPTSGARHCCRKLQPSGGPTSKPAPHWQRSTLAGQNILWPMTGKLTTGAPSSKQTLHEDKP